MSGTPFENLDLACAQTGRSIAEGAQGKPKETEKFVNAALGILEEQGVYAMFLYLGTTKNLAKQVEASLCGFLEKTPTGNPLLGKGEVLSSVSKMSEDLDRLLMAYDLLRQALVYARYHVRIAGESEKKP